VRQRRHGRAAAPHIDGLQSGRYTSTYVNSYHLIGPGTGSNLAVREVAPVTRDGDDVIVRHDDLTIDSK
jgi:hypothetical protein